MHQDAVPTHVEYALVSERRIKLVKPGAASVAMRPPEPGQVLEIRTLGTRMGAGVWGMATTTTRTTIRIRMMTQIQEALVMVAVHRVTASDELLSRSGRETLCLTGLAGWTCRRTSLSTQRYRSSFPAVYWRSKWTILARTQKIQTEQ